MDLNFNCGVSIDHFNGASYLTNMPDSSRSYAKINKAQSFLQRLPTEATKATSKEERL